MKNSKLRFSDCCLAWFLLPDINQARGDRLWLEKKYSTSAMQADFYQLLAQIEKNHPALYDFTSKDEYQAVVKQQFEKIKDSATVTDFYKILLPLVVKIGCGHSQFWLPQRVWQDSAVGFLPLRLFIEKGSVYVCAI